MSLFDDRPRNETIQLSNGKKAIIACNWAAGPAHIVLSASVLVEEPSPGEELVIGDIKGPISHHEANERGATLAENWYRKRSFE